MTDTWGSITVPLGPQRDGQTAGDPALFYLGDFLKTYLTTDANATRQWDIAGVAATFPPVQTVVIGRPDDEGYSFDTKKLPTLFLFRDGTKYDSWGDDWDLERSVLKIVWVLPQGQPDHTRVRLPFMNAMVKCVRNAIDTGRTPSWVQPGDLDSWTPKWGSLLYNYANFAHLLFQASRPVMIRLKNVAGQRVGDFPALEMSYEMVENRVLGLDPYTPILGVTDSVYISTVAPYTTWTAATAYQLNSFVVPTPLNTFYYQATTPGISGTTQPVFPTTVGGTVTDGTVVWTFVGLTTRLVVSGPLEFPPQPGQTNVSPLPNGGGLIPPPLQASQTQVTVTEANAPYNAKATDALILIDNSATGQQIPITFENPPSPGARHRVIWWATPSGGGAPPTITAAGVGVKLASWTSGTGKTSLVSSTAITTLAGEGVWEFVGTTADGTLVNAWVLVG